MALKCDAGKVVERACIGSHDRATRGPCGRGNDEVVSAARNALAAHGDEQLGVRFRDGSVVCDCRNDGNDLVDEGLAPSALLARRERHADSELGDGDCGDRDVVVVIDDVVESVARPFGVDEECRVEQEPAQDRSSISTSSRIDARSFDHPASIKRRRSNFLTSAPRPLVTGSRWATGLPLRTIVKCAPSCSTASRRSAKFRDASVELISGTKSDYQILGRVAARPCGVASAAC